MAFKDVNEKMNGMKSSEMEVGSSIEGYVTDFSEGQFGPIISIEIEGEKKSLFTSGNLKYIVKDKKMKLGLRTRITRLEDEKKKGPKGAITKTMFKVEQDPDDSVAVTPSSTQANTQQEDFKAKIEQLKAGK